MASRREERDYGALPSEQRSEPCVTVADSPTQPTGFNHVCSPSMFSLFLFRFILLRLGFSLPSSSLSAQVYWKHFSSCLWQARQMKNKFQIWSERPFNLWLCFLLVNTVAPPCAYVCVCGASVVYVFLKSLCWRMCLGAFFKHICASECVFMRVTVFRVKECQDKYINLNVLHCVERQNCGKLIRPWLHLSLYVCVSETGMQRKKESWHCTQGFPQETAADGL